MKKIISIVLTLVFVLSAMASLTLFPSAMVEGEWVTSRRANDYEDEGSYDPASGYYYDPALGFVTVSPDLAENRTPYTQAHTRNAIDLKVDHDGKGNSVSLELTVLDFAYDGADVRDEWIAFTINSQPVATPGTVVYGEGVCILIRGSGNGIAQMQPFYVDNEGGKNFSYIQSAGMPTIDVPINQNGQETYTFAVKYDKDIGYYIGINGQWFNDDYLNQLLDRACANGAYIGVHMQSTCPDTQAVFAINEWQGQIPYGEDKAEPEDDLRDLAPIADSAAVPENQPAVLWDATIRDYRKVNVVGGTIQLNDNRTFNMKAESLAPYVVFNVKPEISYEASDFPCVAVLTRNCSANNGLCYFMSGPNISATEDFTQPWTIDDKSYDDGWALGFIDLSDYHYDGWMGRINGLRIRFDFAAEDLLETDYNNFDIGFIGAFRNTDEAIAYAGAYLRNIGIDPDYDPYETTDSPAWETEPITEDVYEETIDEYWPVETETYTLDFGPNNIWEEIEQDTQFDPDDADSLFENSLIGKLISSGVISGCNSVVIAPTLLLITIFGVALFIKKKE